MIKLEISNSVICLLLCTYIFEHYNCFYRCLFIFWSYTFEYSIVTLWIVILFLLSFYLFTLWIDTKIDHLLMWMFPKKIKLDLLHLKIEQEKRRKIMVELNWFDFFFIQKLHLNICITNNDLHIPEEYTLPMGGKWMIFRYGHWKFWMAASVSNG